LAGASAVGSVVPSQGAKTAGGARHHQRHQQAAGENAGMAIGDHRHLAALFARGQDVRQVHRDGGIEIGAGHQ
jgi:hypothetical protein